LTTTHFKTPGVLFAKISTPPPLGPDSPGSTIAEYNNTARNLDMLTNDSPTLAPIDDGCDHDHVRDAPVEYRETWQ
jgi:hypothetical protein